MRIPFQYARMKPIVVGILKFSRFLTQFLPTAAGTTGNSRYCYAVWMRHLVYLSKFNQGKIPLKVLELGPGDSIGVGLAALLSGAMEYRALEVTKYWNIDRNLRIFDEMVILFRNKTRIPDHQEFPLLLPLMDDYSFPDYLISNDVLESSLEKSRLDKIRSEIASPDQDGNHFVKYIIPWFDLSVINPASVDYIFSQSVLQHINDIDHAFHAMQTWLAPSGYMSHVIDFSSMGFTRNWNGHWTATDWEWKIMVGGRDFSINRYPGSEYIRLHQGFGFNILYLNTEFRNNYLDRRKLAGKFRNLSVDDLQTYSYFIISTNNPKS